MSAHHWTDRLSEYLDDELDVSERRELEAHLAACPSCGELLRELRAVVDTAARLPLLAPERDLWPDIESRLEPRHRLMISPSRDAGRRRVALTIPQLLAAGVAIVALSVGTVFGALSLGGPSGATPADLVTADATALDGPTAQFTAAYEAAVSDLEAEFRLRHTELDPRTIVVVERNLAIIDAAIAEARGALAADPSSAFLNTHLANTMRRKVDLLRRVTTMERTEI